MSDDSCDTEKARESFMRTAAASVASLVVAVCACDGSSHRPTTSDLAAAVEARVTEIVDGTGASVSLSWVDAFPDDEGFRIERRSADLSARWSEVATVAGADAIGATLSWSPPPG